MPDSWGPRFGAMIARYRGPVMTQGTLAQLVSDKVGRRVSQSLISELERGNRWGGNLDLIGPLAEILSIPPAEVHEFLGLPLVEGEPRPRTFAEIVAQDPSLSKVAKEHLLAHYELMQKASKQSRPDTQSGESPRQRKTS